MDRTPDRRDSDGPPPPGKVRAALWGGPADGVTVLVDCGTRRVCVPFLREDGFAQMFYLRTESRTRTGAVLFRFGDASPVGPRGVD